MSKWRKEWVEAGIKFCYLPSSHKTEGQEPADSCCAKYGKYHVLVWGSKRLLL